MTYPRALRSLRVVAAGVGLLAFPCVPALATTNLGGDIRENMTLDAAGSPYIVTAGVRVFGTSTTPVTLTIEPGVEIRFNQYLGLQVGYLTGRGALVALGTVAKPIRFRSNQAPTAGYWTNLYFTSATESTSVLDHATVEHCGYAGYGNFGCVRLDGTPTIRNTTISASGNYAIYAGTGGLNIENLTTTATAALYSVSLLVTTAVTTAGTHSFDKPVQLRSGTVGTNTTWRALGTWYELNGSVTISGGATLTIEPGVEVRLPQYQSLTVGTAGTLVSSGTAAAPVRLRRIQADPGYWGYVHFSSLAGPLSVLEYTIVEDCGYASAYGCVRLDGTPGPAIRNTTINRSSSYAIYAGTGGLNIENLTTTDSGSAYALSLAAATPVTTAGSHALDKPIELRAGTVTVDTTWRDLQAPYVATGTITVAKDAATPATLTIEPGVEVRFNQYASLTVGSGLNKGRLVAQGTPALPVTLTSNQGTPKAPGFWAGVWFKTAAGTDNLLDAATVEYAGWASHGNVHFDGAAGTVRNCSIRWSSNYGVHVSGAAAPPVLRDNDFVANATAGVWNEGSGVVDARASFWNHPDGPPGATAERVLGKVAWSPWVVQPRNRAFHALEASLSASSFNKLTGSTTFAATLNLPAQAWALSIANAQGTTVKSFAGAGAAVSVVWSGEQDGNPAQVPNGTYSLLLWAASEQARYTLSQVKAKVAVTDTDGPLAVISAPAANAVLRGGDAVPILGTADDPGDFQLYTVEWGSGSAPTSWYAITPTGGVTTPVVDGLLATWPTVSQSQPLYTLRLTTQQTAPGDGVATVGVRLLLIHSLSATRRYFSPNGDDVADAVTLTASVTLTSNWALTVKNAGGTAVRQFTGSGTAVSVIWDGRNGSGGVVPEGAYTWTVEAVEPGSGVIAVPKTAATSLVVDVTAPVADIVAPAAADTVHGIVLITGTASDANNFLNYRLEYGSGPAPGSWTQIYAAGGQVVDGTLNTWTTNSFRDETLVPNGVTTIRLTVRDLADNSAVDQVTVTFDNLLVSAVERMPEAIRPTLGETATIQFTLDQSATVTLRIHPEQTALRVYPDQTPEAGAVRMIALGSRPAGVSSVAWDGRDDAGVPVNEEAYIYILEAVAPSGRFDKFNRYVNLDGPGSGLTILGHTIPATATSYDPYKNQFVSHTTPPTAVARGRLWVAYSIANPPQACSWSSMSLNMTTIPTERPVFEPGPITLFWDGRDGGEILTGATRICYYLVGNSSPFVEHLQALKANHVVVLGIKPRVPGVSIKSDPYIVTLSYSHITRLKYELLDDAVVTVTVRDPVSGTVATLLAAQAQTAGVHEVVWDGTDGAGQLAANPGHYTFTVTATEPTSGASTVRRGNITVFQ